MSQNLALLDDSTIQELLNKKLLKIGVIGIGRIGMPTALCFADSGFQTIGIDINEKLVEMVNSGEYPLKDEPEFDKLFDKATSEKKFTAITDISKAIPSCDIILLSLPTPMDDSNIPDYNALLTVGKSLGKLLSNGQIVVVESTVEPGFIENDLLSIIEASSENNLKCGQDFHLAVCPETANPGEIMNDFKKLPRLVGALNQKITSIVSQIYTHVFGVELVPMPNCKTANAVKLTTNVFRDVNIAFVNELSILFEKLGIDTHTVINAAKRKYNFQPHYPGPGVGGPCLPVNSYQFLNSSSKVNFPLKLVNIAREINENMPNHVIDNLIHLLQTQNKSVNSSNVVILGISYKPNVRDVQIAPSENIINLLKQKNSKIKIFDPFFLSTEIFSIMTEKTIDDALDNADAVILVTAHDSLRKLNLELFSKKMNTPILLDCTGTVNSEDAKKHGLIFKGIGRGESSIK